ncbi:hypothetical protein SprV_0501764100 [Sparganum proliferum]
MGSGADIQKHLDAVFLDIQFTMEEEDNKQLAFLDVIVRRKDCGGLKTKVFRKATNTMEVLNFNSNHPISHKRSCVRTLYLSVETHCSEPENRVGESQYLRQVFKANGYPRNFVNRCIRKKDEKPNCTDQILAGASVCQERFESRRPPSRTTWGWSCSQTGGNHQASGNETERPTATVKNVWSRLSDLVQLRTKLLRRGNRKTTPNENGRTRCSGAEKRRQLSSCGSFDEIRPHIQIRRD